jgi:transposase
VTRPTMRFVTVKSNEQLDVQALHRLRDRLVAQRTATINQIRAFLIEYGTPSRRVVPPCDANCLGSLRMLITAFQAGCDS